MDRKRSFDATQLTLKILSCIYRVRERCNAAMIASILCGKESQQIKDLGFEKLSTFGIIKKLNINQVKAVICLLLQKEIIARSFIDNNLKLTVLGKSFLKKWPKLYLPQKLLDDNKKSLFPLKLQPSHFKTLEYVNCGLTISQIAQKRGVKVATIEEQIAELIYHGKIEDLSALLTKEKENLIKDRLPFDSVFRLKDIKSQLPPDISYGEIKMVLAKVAS